MKTRFYFFVLLIFGVILLFAQASKSDNNVLSQASVESALITKCYVCHNPRVKKSDDMIAPPMVSVKYMYKLRYPDQEQFVANMSNFVTAPNDTKAVMKGRVMTHGVMPDLSFEENEVKAISEYIYKMEIEVPSWFPEHFEKKHGIKWETQ